MSFAELLLISTVRATLVGVVAAGAGRIVAAGVTGVRSPSHRRALIFLAAAPLVMPPLLTGYAYYNYSLSLVHAPLLNELWYAALSAMRWSPLAAAVWVFAPSPPTSRSAAHCRRMSPFARRRIIAVAAIVLHGPGRTALAAAAAVFLLAFADMDAASLMGVRSWTVWLFDAAAMHMEVAEALPRALAAAGVQAAALAIVAAVLLAGGGRIAAPRGAPASRRVRALAWAIVALACLAVVVVPIALVGRGASAGVAGVLRHGGIWREVVVSIAFAACGSLAAVLVGRTLARCRRPVLAAAVVLPGLLGSLILALCVQAVFLGTPLRSVYDSPLPLMLALTLALAPAVFVLCLLADAIAPATPSHLATLLRRCVDPSRRAAGARLLWLMHGRGVALVAAAAFWVAYFELTCAAILAPPSLVPATVRLFNLMHYGHTPALSAMLLLTVAVPVLILASAALATRFAETRLRGGVLRA